MTIEEHAEHCRQCATALLDGGLNSLPLCAEGESILEPYEVFDLTTDESQGSYATLTEAHGAVRFDKLKAYSIWRGSVRVECCDPYEGDDDRVKQALGLANASEEEESR